jgi:glycosyltransferase involved in cell wall biosynthesis
MRSASPAIPVIVSAKNEERSIVATLDALVVARSHAEATSERTFVIFIVVDDSTDRTLALARHHSNRHERVAVLVSRGGKVEAQRAGWQAARSHDGAGAPSFAIFCDADVRPSREVLLALATLLDAKPEIQVATCALRPVPPRRRSLLAAALHTYNLRRGFSSSRTWFNGKLFAIRSWNVPTRTALAPNITRLASRPDAFYDFEAGITIDDIYLSRAIVAEYGPAAIAEASAGVVLFRAPETWRGMHRYYRRMRRELERLDLLVPELASAHRAHGRRRPDLLVRAPRRERMHYALFDVALGGCRLAYVMERAWVRHVRRTPRPWWLPVEETKAW